MSVKSKLDILMICLKQVETVFMMSIDYLNKIIVIDFKKLSELAKEKKLQS
jgi:hypothetical protein